MTLASIKLTNEDKQKIQKFEDFLKETKIDYKEEKYRLLDDGINAFKQELYYAAFATMWIFVEKSLRDILIFKEWKEKDEKHDIDQEYDEIEKMIEDGGNGVDKYSFKKICDALVIYEIIDSMQSDTLKGLYDLYRIPAHHGIYRRFVDYSMKNPQAIEIGLEEIIKDITQSEGEMCLNKNRIKILTTAMKSASLIMLTYLTDTIKLIEKNK